MSQHNPARRVWVWGLPLAPMTMAEALAEAEKLIEVRRPSFFITANLNYAMLTAAEPRLREVNDRAAFVLADGMPLVWAARDLPERVAGADLLLKLCELSARKQHRIFLLGGPPGVAERAASELQRRYQGLVIAGTECPPFRERTPDEDRALAERVREARPDLLFVAFGQPKGELWISAHLDDLGVPLSVQIGGSFDFVTGRLRRAPRWMQRSGLEWVYRFMQEPRRLGARYASNLGFLVRMTLGSLFLGRRRRRESRRRAKAEDGLK